MAGTKKINKAKAREPVVNTYEIIAGIDGNPNSPEEFDNSPHDDDEHFFKADEDATKAEKNKVLMLNFVHKELHHVTERKVPVLDVEKGNPNIEVYHRVKFQGVELDVCVYWPPRAEGSFKSCLAMVKFTSDDLSTSNDHGANSVIVADAAWNADAKADKFTLKNDELVKNYWAPRWKYVVNALRSRAYNAYEKNGVEKPEPEESAEANDDAEDGDTESQEEREEQISVFSGASGKIIGPKGAKIQEIKKVAGVKDIKMPEKNEDGSRPRARELVQITFIGKPRAIAKAKTMIQEVVDEWANAPRPSRDGGAYQTQTSDFTTTGGDAATDSFGGGDANFDAGGGGIDWHAGGADSGEAGGW